MTLFMVTATQQSRQRTTVKMAQRKDICFPRNSVKETSYNNLGLCLTVEN